MAGQDGATWEYRLAPLLGESELNALNREVLVRLQERGIAVPSGTTLGGRFAIRVANVNHRTRMDDLEALVEGVRSIAGELTPVRSP